MLSVALINVPLRVPSDPETWITVPPQAYGGIQWAVAHLADGLLACGLSVYLLGAPGSRWAHPRMTVVDAAEPREIAHWLSTARVDVVHDHSNGVVALPDLGQPFVSTHHLTGRPRYSINAVYLSYAQRADAGSTTAPVVRLPVNPERCQFSASHDGYLLTLSRVSRWKGVREAAAFAAAAGLPLYMAGPAWEPDYLNEIVTTYPGVAKYVGEVGGQERLDLLSRARALMVLSQPTQGPWGGRWCEPGAAVVSEAAASGTPVIGSTNGCLPEIVPHVGVVMRGESTFAEARRVLASLKTAEEVAAAAVREWTHIGIASQYVHIYHDAISGREWR